MISSAISKLTVKKVFTLLLGFEDDFQPQERAVRWSSHPPPRLVGLDVRIPTPVPPNPLGFGAVEAPSRPLAAGVTHISPFRPYEATSEVLWGRGPARTGLKPLPKPAAPGVGGGGCRFHRPVGPGGGGCRGDGG